MDESNECISNDGIITVEQFKAIYPQKRKSKIEAALCESLEDLQKQNSSLEQYIENFIEIADKLAEKYNREREEREGIIHPPPAATSSRTANAALVRKAGMKPLWLRW